MTRFVPALSAPVLLVAAALLGATAARAAAPDWNAVADVGTIEILSTNEDGSKRETTIWLIVVEGQGYVRTGSTRWGANVERDPEVVVRIEGAEYPLRAERVTDSALVERLNQAFRAKYGFSDAITGLFRWGEPRLMRLVPAAGLGPVR